MSIAYSLIVTIDAGEAEVDLYTPILNQISIQTEVRLGITDLVNQTGLGDFGHFCAEVPKSLRIGAYPRVLLIAAVCRAATKPLQAAIFTARWSRRPA